MFAAHVVQDLRADREAVPGVIRTDPGSAAERAHFHGAVDVAHPVDRIIIDIAATEAIVQSSAKGPERALLNANEDLQEIIMTYNLTPRKCLSYLTPIQALFHELGRDVRLRFA